MDQKAFIRRLQQIFRDTNRENKRHSAVWLSDVDLGGMYSTSKYVLNVKTEHQIDNCNDEIVSVLELLDEKAKDELKSIWRVAVYNADEELQSNSEDIMLYSQPVAC